MMGAAAVRGIALQLAAGVADLRRATDAMAAVN